jgi:hypothetical protein
VRVPCDEGVVNRISPEPCASNGEASVGECIGQSSSREKTPDSGGRRCGMGGRQQLAITPCPYRDPSVIASRGKLNRNSPRTPRPHRTAAQSAEN